MTKETKVSERLFEEWAEAEIGPTTWKMLSGQLKRLLEKAWLDGRHPAPGVMTEDEAVDLMMEAHWECEGSERDSMRAAYRALAKNTPPSVMDGHLLWLETCLEEYPGEKSGAVRAALDYIRALAALEKYDQLNKTL